jgi:ATP-dependent DNA ligase
MLARLASALPEGDGYLYEPKWDGFRCLAFRDGDDVDLRSRHDRPLARYFPEVVDALKHAPFSRVVFDGELISLVDGVPDFSALLGRLHPAASRAAQLAQRTPAAFVAFDLLALGEDDLTQEPFSVRRQRLLEVLAASQGPLRVTPATSDADEAERWLESFTGAGLDGVVAKEITLRYLPGKRAMVKVKGDRTADCVVAGARAFDGPLRVASLLLGVYDEHDLLHHIGVASSFTEQRRVELWELVSPYAVPLAEHPWRGGFGLEGGALGRLGGTAGRWTPDMSRDWLPLQPELVCEVRYDKLEGLRFRHPAKVLRLRPDRTPQSCTYDQFETDGVSADQILDIPR